MKLKLSFLTLVLLVLFAFTACDGFDLLRGNLFADLETPPKALTDLAAGDSDTLVQDLKAYKLYSSFYEDLKQDTTAKNTILENLNTVITTADTPAKVQEASLLYVDIQLNTTSAGVVTQGVVSLAEDLIPLLASDSEEPTDAPDVQEVFVSLFNGIEGDDLDATLDAMVASASAFDAYVTSMYNPDTDQYEFPPETNVVEVATAALTCALIEAIGVDSMKAVIAGEEELIVDETTFEGSWVVNLFEALGNYFTS